MMRKPIRFLARMAPQLLREVTRPRPDTDASLRKRRVDALIQWLSLAQERTPDGGVSEGYHLFHGWLPSYPETTGYIIETFWDYLDRTGDPTIRDRAIRMAEWLLDVQRPDGSIPDARLEHPMVFDTGQVLFGFLRAFEELGDDRYRDAALAAGDWLVGVQDDDGAWRRHAMRGIPHTYYARVGWALARLHGSTGDDKYASAARRNADWVITQQRESGWFHQAAFKTDDHPTPVTHTIAYTIRGLLETGVVLGERKYVECAERAMDGFARAYDPGSLPSGTYDIDWNGDSSFSCLTGNAQLAIIAIRLAEIQGSREWFDLGGAINRRMGAIQDLEARDRNVRGAIAGSSPVWGSYIHFAYPNWAAKFYAEALMFEERVEGVLGGAINR